MITEDIIKQAQAGDSEAFAMIYNETIKKITKYKRMGWKMV